MTPAFEAHPLESDTIWGNNDRFVRTKVTFVIFHLEAAIVYTALTPAANEITKLGLDATDLPTHIASAAQGQVSVHPVVDSVLALG